LAKRVIAIAIWIVTSRANEIDHAVMIGIIPILELDSQSHLLALELDSQSHFLAHYILLRSSDSFEQ